MQPARVNKQRHTVPLHPLTAREYGGQKFSAAAWWRCTHLAGCSNQLADHLELVHIIFAGKDRLASATRARNEPNGAKMWKPVSMRGHSDSSEPKRRPRNANWCSRHGQTMNTNLNSAEECSQHFGQDATCCPDVDRRVIRSCQDQLWRTVPTGDHILCHRLLICPSLIRPRESCQPEIAQLQVAVALGQACRQTGRQKRTWRCQRDCLLLVLSCSGSSTTSTVRTLTSRFPGLRSRCQTLAEWMYFRAQKIYGRHRQTGPGG